MTVVMNTWFYTYGRKLHASKYAQIQMNINRTEEIWIGLVIISMSIFCLWWCSIVLKDIIVWGNGIKGTQHSCELYSSSYLLRSSCSYLEAKDWCRLMNLNTIERCLLHINTFSKYIESLVAIAEMFSCKLCLFWK